MRIGPARPSSALARQSQLVHGRFSFQDEAGGSSPPRPTTRGNATSNGVRARLGAVHRMTPYTKGNGSSWIFEPCLTWANALQRVQHPAFALGMSLQHVRTWERRVRNLWPLPCEGSADHTRPLSRACVALHRPSSTASARQGQVVLHPVS